jgi:hypothetical protein
MKKLLYKKLQNAQSGQSLVEFAISLTVILYLLVGAIEFGIALFQYVQLRDAAQEGALYGALHPTDDPGISAHVQAASSSPIDLQNDPDVNITITIHDDNGVPNEPCEGDGIEVAITYPHRVFLPFVSSFIGSNTIPINVSVTDTVLLPICP